MPFMPNLSQTSKGKCMLSRVPLSPDFMCIAYSIFSDQHSSCRKIALEKKKPHIITKRMTSMDQAEEKNQGEKLSLGIIFT
jgi:hypothetical protein